MSALTVTAAEAARSETAKLEMKQIMQEGASTGVAAIMGVGDFDAGSPPKMGDLVEAVALAIIRMGLPVHSCADAPSPAGREGRTIYVNDGAEGAPIVAFSDGTFWLRVDTRGAISPS